MRRNLNVFVVIFSLSSLFSACSGSLPGGKELSKANTGKEIVSINGTDIREGYLNALATINPRIKAQIGNPATRKQLVQNVVEQELLYQESLKRGLDKKPDVLQKAELYSKIIVAQALLEDELAVKAKKYYEDNKDTEFTKVKISQIQINFLPEDSDKKDAQTPSEPTQAQKDAALAKAKVVIEKLKAGEDFAKLAEELTEDKLGKKKGGDFGPVSKNDKRLARRGLEALGTAAFNLKKDQFSDPIEAKDGYHIIKVTSDPEITAYEDADKIIRFQIQKNVKDDLVSQLTKASNIKYADGEKPATTIPVKTEPLAPGNESAGQPDATTPPEAQNQNPPANKQDGNTFKPVLKTGEEKTN